MPGTGSLDSAYVGEVPIKEIYVGESKIWPAGNGLVLILKGGDGIFSIDPNGHSPPVLLDDLSGSYVNAILYVDGKIYYNAKETGFYSMVPKIGSTPEELFAGPTNIDNVIYANDKFYIGKYDSGFLGYVDDINDIAGSFTALLAPGISFIAGITYGDGNLYYSHHSSGNIWQADANAPSTPVKLADALIVKCVHYIDGVLYYSDMSEKIYSLVPDGLSSPVEITTGSHSLYGDGNLYYFTSGTGLGGMVYCMALDDPSSSFQILTILPNVKLNVSLTEPIYSIAAAYIDQKIYYVDSYTRNLYSFTPEPSSTKVVDSSEIPTGYQILAVAAGDGKLYVSMTDSATDARIYAVDLDGSSAPVELVNSLTEGATSLIYGDGKLYYSTVSALDDSGAIYSLVPDGLSSPENLASSALLKPAFLVYANETLYFSNITLFSPADLGVYSLVPDGVSSPVQLTGGINFNLTYVDGTLYYVDFSNEIYSLVPDGVSSPDFIVNGVNPVIIDGALYYYEPTNQEIYYLLLDGVSSPVKIADSTVAWMTSGGGDLIIADNVNNKIYRRDVKDVIEVEASLFLLDLADAEIVNESGSIAVDYAYYDNKLYYFNAQDGCIYSIRTDKGTKLADNVGDIDTIIEAYV